MCPVTWWRITIQRHSFFLGTLFRHLLASFPSGKRIRKGWICDQRTMAWVTIPFFIQPMLGFSFTDLHRPSTDRPFTKIFSYFGRWKKVGGLEIFFFHGHQATIFFFYRLVAWGEDFFLTTVNFFPSLSSGSSGWFVLSFPRPAWANPRKKRKKLTAAKMKRKRTTWRLSG